MCSWIIKMVQYMSLCSKYKTVDISKYIYSLIYMTNIDALTIHTQTGRKLSHYISCLINVRIWVRVPRTSLHSHLWSERWPTSFWKSEAADLTSMVGVEGTWLMPKIIIWAVNGHPHMCQLPHVHPMQKYTNMHKKQSILTLSELKLKRCFPLQQRKNEKLENLCKSSSWFCTCLLGIHLNGLNDCCSGNQSLWYNCSHKIPKRQIWNITECVCKIWKFIKYVPLYF